MTILTCECGNEIYIMDETEATAWQCDACGQWYDLFGNRLRRPPAGETVPEGVTCMTQEDF